MVATWARGLGVTLLSREAGAAWPASVEQALRDGIERGYGGDLPLLPAAAEAFDVRAGGEVAGVLAFVRELPRPDAVTFVAVAIAPDARGSALGARALLAAERRLRRDSVASMSAVVPRTNGRGLYFMLRCGYAPLSRPPEGGSVFEGCTWFARSERRLKG